MPTLKRIDNGEYMKNRNNRLIALLIVIITAFASLTFMSCSAFKIPRFTVNFHAEKGGAIIKTQTVRSASYLNYPTVEADAGYVFSGYKNEKDDEIVYYAGKDRSEQPDIEYEDVNDFYAFFTSVGYTVTYDFNGGSGEKGKESYTVDDTFSIPDPEKSGLVFIGWTSELNAYPQVDYTVEQGTTGNLNFVACWGETDSFYLNFKTKGGSDVEGQTNKTGVFASKPADPIKNGYEFVRWVKEDGNEAKFPLTTNRTVTTLTAEWKIVSYVITCPSIPAFTPITYTIEEEVTVPKVEKEGYTFTGYTYAGLSSPKNPLVIKKGTYGDIELTPHFKINTYAITFETSGGSEIEDAKYEFGAKTTAPEPPTRKYCDFVGWYEDEALTVPHVFSDMPAKNLTLYAKWHSDREYALTYSVKNSSASVDCNVESGKKAVYADRITMSVPAIEGGAFKQWLKNGEFYSYNPSISFSMPDEELEFVAEYSPATQLSFDKSAPKNLALPLTNVGFIAGNGLMENDYVTGAASLSAHLKADYLSSLKDGVYPFYYSSAENVAGEYFIVAVTSNSSVKNLKIDYDTNYPEVTVTFDCDKQKTYEYSLDGSAYKDIASGFNFSKYAYDKSRAHTLTVRATDNESDSATVSKNGYTSATKECYENSFVYGGVSHDLVAESFEELKIICEYLAYVLAPNDTSLSTSLKFSVLGEWAEEKGVAEAMTSIGIPYSPTYTYNNISVLRPTISLTIKKHNSVPNSKTSGQQKVPVSDSQKLLTASSRTSGSPLKMDDFALSQEIRSIYELENLPYGVKPSTFTSQDAQTVYNSARKILTEIIDDNMNDFEKVAAIYSYLALNVTYDDVVANMANTTDTTVYRAFTTYGALVDKTAVCDGIAGAVRLMCLMEGIPATEVAGLGNGGGHAWNKVEIYGLTYGLDATWSRAKVNSEYYVTNAYLFIDEKKLYGTTHIECGNAAKEKRFSGDIAFNANDYFSLELNGVKHLVSNKNEFDSLIKSVKSRGGTTVELKVAPGANLNTLIAQSSCFSLFNQPRTCSLSNGSVLLFF